VHLTKVISITLRLHSHTRHSALADLNFEMQAVITRKIS
jgi:hypothetical protein